MKQAYLDVRAFHDACAVPVLPRPAVPDGERVALRVKLLREEYDELRAAMFDESLVEIADAIADLIYVAIGTALEYGIPLPKVWDEVQRANMAKRQPDGTVLRRDDGKIIKPDGWEPPNIEGALWAS